MAVTEPLTCPDLQAGKMARVECQLSVGGRSVTWLKDSKELELGVKYQFITEGKKQALLIKDFGDDDQGVYTCVASSEAESSINLTIKGKEPHSAYSASSHGLCCLMPSIVLVCQTYLVSQARVYLW